MSSSSGSSRLFALIPCGGMGSRAGGGGPKQYRVIAGQTVLAHTLTAFGAVMTLASVCVAVAHGDDASDQPASLAVAAARLKSSVPFLIAACAGSTRAETVLNGLNVLLTQGAKPSDWVLVHDAARCLVTPLQIATLVDACREDPVGGLLAHKLPDTLKQEGAGGATGRVAGTLDRSDKWLAQTPQMFRIGALREALLQAGDAVTDEASAMETMGLQPRLVPGSAQNFKVTYPEDFALAEAILQNRAL